MTGINVSMTVTHSSSSTLLYNGSLNQSSSQQSYNNLSEGQLWINLAICDILSRCSNSTVLLYVDNTPPSVPSYSSPMDINIKINHICCKEVLQLPFLEELTLLQTFSKQYVINSPTVISFNTNQLLFRFNQSSTPRSGQQFIANLRTKLVTPVTQYNLQLEEMILRHGLNI